MPVVRIGLVTVSDTRDAESDRNGAWLAGAADVPGLVLVHKEIVRDDPGAISASLDRALAAGADLLVFNGGTGIAPRDTTVDVVAPRFRPELPGFGELFRMLSFAEIGSAAMLSRAAAGVVDGVPCFCLPGSHAAVQLAWTRLIAPEIGHLVSELRRPAGTITASNGTD